MDERLNRSNKLPGSEKLTRPEEIKQLSKYLKSIKEAYDESTRLEDQVVGVSGFSTGRIPEIGELGEKQVKAPENQGEKINLKEKILEVPGSNKEIELENTKLNLTNRKEVELGNKKVERPGKEEKIQLENIIQKIKKAQKETGLSEKRLDIADSRLIALDNTRLELKAMINASLEKKRINLEGTEHDIKLGDKKVELGDIEGKERLETKRINLEDQKEVELGEKRLDIQDARIGSLENKRVELSAETEVRLGEKRVDLKDEQTPTLSNTKIRLTDERDTELGNKRVDIQDSPDPSLSDKILSITPSETPELPTKKIKTGGENPEVELGDKKIEIEDDKEISLPDTKLQITNEKENRLGEKRLDIKGDQPENRLEEKRLDLTDERERELDNKKVDLKIGNHPSVELGEKRLDIYDDWNGELEDKRVELKNGDPSIDLSNKRVDLKNDDWNGKLEKKTIELEGAEDSNPSSLSNRTIKILGELKDVTGLEDKRLDLVDDRENKLEDTRLDLTDERENELEDKRLDLTDERNVELGNKRLDLIDNRKNELEDKRIDISGNKNPSLSEDEQIELEDTRLDLIDDRKVSLSDKILNLIDTRNIGLEDKRLDLTDDRENKLEDKRLDLTDDRENKLEDKRLDLTDDRENELEDKRLDLTDDRENKLEDTRLDLTDERENELEDKRLDLTDDRENELEDTRLNLTDERDVELGDKRIDLEDERETSLSDKILSLIDEREIELEDDKVELSENLSEAPNISEVETLSQYTDLLDNSKAYSQGESIPEDEKEEVESLSDKLIGLSENLGKSPDISEAETLNQYTSALDNPEPYQLGEDIPENKNGEPEELYDFLLSLPENQSEKNEDLENKLINILEDKGKSPDISEVETLDQYTTSLDNSKLYQLGEDIPESKGFNPDWNDIDSIKAYTSGLSDNELYEFAMKLAREGEKNSGEMNGWIQKVEGLMSSYLSAEHVSPKRIIEFRDAMNAILEVDYFTESQNNQVKKSDPKPLSNNNTIENLKSGFYRVPVDTSSGTTWARAEESVGSRLTGSNRRDALDEMIVKLVDYKRENLPRLPGNDNGNNVGTEIEKASKTTEENMKGLITGKSEHNNPINKPFHADGMAIPGGYGDTLYQAANNRTNLDSRDPIGDTVGNTFLSRYWSSKSFKATLEELCPIVGKVPVASLTELKALLKSSPYITTPGKFMTDTKGSYNTFSLDTNMYWEITLEPFCLTAGTCSNGGWSYLPSIKEINYINKKIHDVSTSYGYWAPINSFELQKSKLTTKSLPLYEGEIAYPTGIDFTNELRLTFVDDAWKSWKRYFERCAEVAVYNSTAWEASHYATTPKSDADITRIDKSNFCVASYKNVTFNIKIYILNPQLNLINKFNLLCVLKDYSEDYIGEVDSGGTDLTVSFSIVGENPQSTDFDIIKDASIGKEIAINLTKQALLEAQKRVTGSINSSVGLL